MLKLDLHAPRRNRQIRHDPLWVRGISKGGGGAPIGLLRGGRVRCNWASGSMTSMTSMWCLQIRGQCNTLDPALILVCALFLVPRLRRTREFKTPRALWPVAACGCVFPEAIVVPSAISGAPYIDAWVFLPVECKYFFEGGFLLFKWGPRWPPRSVGFDDFLITSLVDKEKREMRAVWYMDDCGVRMRSLVPSHCTCWWEGKRSLTHEIWMRRWW